jgi:hypothetical protein
MTNDSRLHVFDVLVWSDGSCLFQKSSVKDQLLEGKLSPLLLGRFEIIVRRSCVTVQRPSG